jgi:hypothetical protein
MENSLYSTGDLKEKKRISSLFGVIQAKVEVLRREREKFHDIPNFCDRLITVWCDPQRINSNIHLLSLPPCLSSFQQPVIASDRRPSSPPHEVQEQQGEGGHHDASRVERNGKGKRRLPR